MSELQLWFEPLLWACATIAALVAFVRLCKPVWKIFTAPKEFSEKLDLLNNRLDNKFKGVDEKFDKIDVRLDNQNNSLKTLSEQNAKEDAITLSLLHDSIVQIYQLAKEQGTISEVSYFRACELYKQNGNSQYIDSIMSLLKEMHEKGVNNET